MLVYYESADKKQKIVFDGKAYGIADLDLFQYEFKCNTENNKITEFLLGIVNRKIEVNISTTNEKSWQRLYEEMNQIFLKDIANEKPGRLYINGSYMSCFFYASIPEEMFEDYGFQIAELKIITDYAAWIEEQMISIKEISKNAMSEEGIKKYPYTSAYKYPLLQTETSVYIDHYKDSDFKITAYGPATSVKINIADHPYEVAYPLEAGEYMVIDSRTFVEKDKRLYVVRVNGEAENIFNYRSTEHSVFKKIPAGLIKIDYSRTYGVDIIVFKERSEPPWKSLL